MLTIVTVVVIKVTMTGGHCANALKFRVIYCKFRVIYCKFRVIYCKFRVI